MKVNFQSYDTIIMQSIYFGQGIFKTGATVTKIIRLGDSLDRSIIGYEHLMDALPKFLTYGLIDLRNEKVYLTKKYRQIRKNSKKEVRKVGSETERIDLIFSELTKEECKKMKELPDGFLTKPKWHSAYAKYSSEFKK